MAVSPIAELARTATVPARRSAPAAREVRSRRTPTSLSRVRTALATAHRRLTGRNATGAMLDILTAHVSHETGRGERMFNYNFGGIKGTGPQGLTARYRTTEFFNGNKTKLVDGFRAYRNLEEGAGDYLRLLKSRYGAAFDQAARGDVNGFSSALKSRGYFTAPVDAYAQAMRGNLRHVQGGETPRGIEPVRKAGSYLYGAELQSEALVLDGGEAAGLPTALAVARVIDSVSAMNARIGSPIEVSDDENDS